MAPKAQQQARVTIVAASPSDEAWLRKRVDSALAAIVRAYDSDDAIQAHSRIVVIGDPASPPADVDHVINRGWSPESLRALVTALATGRLAPAPVPSPPNTPAEAAAVLRGVAAARRLAAASDAGSWETIVVDAIVEILELDRARCLYYDAAKGLLWSEWGQSGETTDDLRAVNGVVGFAAKTGLAVVAPRASDDPRFAPAIDDPRGEADDQLIVQPIRGLDDTVHAVLVGVRRAHRQQFGIADATLLERFARLASPTLEQLDTQQHAQTVLDETVAEAHLFRSEAIDAQLQPRWGDVVRVSPSWLPWAYRTLGLVVVVATASIAMTTVSTYSTGPAVIRSLARTPVIARTAGNIVFVDVMPGDHVTAGTVIARFDDTDHRETVSRLERELEMHLRNRMGDPRDTTADALLRNVRDQLASANAALDERLIRATTSGVVGDIRVRPGQHVEHGNLVSTVLQTNQGLEVIAMLPGEHRPQLVPGMLMRLELEGYQYAYQRVVIESVSPDVISPVEARRVLGSEIADGIALGAPVVLVRGRLASAQFVVDDRALAYHDGMRGIAEAHIGTEPTAFALIPGLRRLR